MRTSMLFMVVVAMAASACTLDDVETTAPTMPPAVAIPSLHLDYDKLTGAPVIKETDRDVCALAAQLPSGDICAMICDPDAMKAQLRAEGEPAGKCIELSCGLPDDSRVIVGVCLPPE